jgi:preprotein translocase subunit SecA
MAIKNFVSNLRRYHQQLNGSTTVYDLSSYCNTTDKISELASSLKEKSDSQLRESFDSVRCKAISGISADSLLNDSFSIIKETVSRVMGISVFDEQITGAIVLSEGKIAQMQTGEGKTLTAVFPACLYALYGKGVHVLTFNDYLAQRDCEWMKPVYDFLGFQVSYVNQHMNSIERCKAYGADITYTTAKESGFDYLRDKTCYNKNDTVHRQFHFAIIDEADSILIDEARVPLVIAGAIDECENKKLLSNLVRNLRKEVDFEFDEYCRNVFLTENGISFVENELHCVNLYDESNSELLQRLYYALHAEYLLSKDKDYIVRDGRVEIVDELTGRVAVKRKWPDGLHSAVEEKENCRPQPKGRILNSITLQHFVQLYPKKCGMTATALESEEEFREFYGLPIVVIPTHRQCIRKDYDDRIYKTKQEKYRAVIEEIIAVNKTSRPVLVGTQSVGESATVAGELLKENVSCVVLNAKDDAREAEIIAAAGVPGAVTISTNMAGRGTDIVPGGGCKEKREKVISLGGLYVIGTNRYESRRIDNQLRGRAGRQGDPGSSRFFISLEDDLFVKFRLKDLITKEKLSNIDRLTDNPVVKKEIDRIQRIIEGQNLDIKITLFKYSIITEQQRQIITGERDLILNDDNHVMDIFRCHSAEKLNLFENAVVKEDLLKMCRSIYLSHIDKRWSEFLAEIQELKESIHLRRIGGQNPLFEFRKLSIDLFDRIFNDLEDSVVNSFNKLSIVNGKIESGDTSIKSPSATWTYLVNDDPFEHRFGLEMVTNIGFNAIAGFWWPITFLLLLVKKACTKKK